MSGTCSTCGQSLHSDLSRVHGRCGPCRWGDDAAAEPEWRRLVAPTAVSVALKDSPAPPGAPDERGSEPPPPAGGAR